MSPAPAPSGRITDPDDAPRVRRLDCRRYTGCLEVAHAQDWHGFTCNGCEAHEPQSEDEARADLDGLARLLAARAERNDYEAEA